MICTLSFGWLAYVLSANGQTGTTGGGPRVVVPTVARPMEPARPAAPASRIVYPWKKHISCTVFWVGEAPGPRNPTPNDKSSWDQDWVANFGGTDDPDPESRVANHAMGDFRPKAFVPKLNPFYVALPYNDVERYNAHKPEAARVIPWFARMNPQPGKTVLKGRWVQIYHNGRICFAQWEDCGPWNTDDWEYVFGSAQQPKTKENNAAGIDISPSVRDYLGAQSGQKVHWRFVEAGQVPYGPWKKYGQAPVLAPGQDLEQQRRYMEHLRNLRDEAFLNRPLHSR
jgi:hypothetical protein